MFNRKNQVEKVFQGTIISPGMASGRAFIYTDILLRDHGLYTIRPSDFRDEYRRIEQAITDVRRELALSAERVQKELNAQIAGIFLSQGEILRDPELIKEIRRELESSLVNAEQIVKRVFRKWELRFRQVQDERISYRADDIVDLSRRMILALTGIHAHMLEKLPATVSLSQSVCCHPILCFCQESLRVLSQSMAALHHTPLYSPVNLVYHL